MPEGDEASLGRMRQVELENDKKIFGKVSLIICRVKVPFFHEVTESLLLIRMASQNVLRTAEFFSGQDPHVSGGTSRGGGGGAPPYLAYTAMCRWSGYGSQGLESYNVYTI